MLPEALKRNRVYRRLEQWRLERAFDRHLSRLGVGEAFDPDFKRRFMSGERFSVEEVAERYDRIWEKFADDCVRGDDLESIVEHLDPDSRTCVDVGCGSGRVAIAVARAGRAVTGTDISAAALARAAAAAAEAGVEIDWVQASIESLPFPDRSFDVVLCSHTLEHVQDVSVAAAELRRVARRQLMIIVPREQGLNVLSTDYHLQYFPDAESLRSAVGLPHAKCVAASTDNEQWHGDYLFLVADVNDAQATDGR